MAAPVNDRATIADVRDYYTDYVREFGLEQYFMNGHVVTSVQKVLESTVEIDSESGECGAKDNCDKTVCWEVCGKQTDLNTNDVWDFCYKTKNVILAVGSHDQPNRLGVPGETLPYVMHSLHELEERIDSGQIDASSHPVLIVGAGLSVGDAITTLESSQVPMYHVFRRKANDPALVFRQLSTVQYPDYHRIHTLMTGSHSTDYYTPYQRHCVGEFLPDGRVIIYEKSDPHKTPKIIQTSGALVLIGSKPDLTFMRKGGKYLGINPHQRIDSKSNPLDVNPYTYESNLEPGLFGMGALVGDNFVRFLLGGSLAICRRLLEKLRKPSGNSC